MMFCGYSEVHKHKDISLFTTGMCPYLWIHCWRLEILGGFFWILAMTTLCSDCNLKHIMPATISNKRKKLTVKSHSVNGTFANRKNINNIGKISKLWAVSTPRTLMHMFLYRPGRGRIAWKPTSLHQIFMKNAKPWLLCGLGWINFNGLMGKYYFDVLFFL